MSLKLPGAQRSPGQLPTLSSRRHENLNFAIGEVQEVDVERQKMYIKLSHGYSGIREVDISQAYAGTSSFISATPQRRSKILLASTDYGLVPISYLPNYDFGFENKIIDVTPKDVKNDSLNTLLYRMRKLKEGEVALSSSEGIEIFLGDKFKLEDSFGNSIELRPEINSIFNISGNTYNYNSGIWQRSGIVRRNFIDNNKIDEYDNVFKEPLSGGDFGFVLRPFNSDTPSDPYLTEYLIEVEDTGYNSSPEDDVISRSNDKSKRPISIFSMGNLIGNNPEIDNYGKVLKPVLFTDPDDEFGSFLLEQVDPNYYDSHAMAITLFKPDRLNPELGAFFGIDKEGHMYQYLPSSTGGGLGRGRSMSIVARGNKKEIWGKDTKAGNSWDLITEGGLKWVVGEHNDLNENPQKGLSIDIKTEGTSLFKYGSTSKLNLKSFKSPLRNLSNIVDYSKIEIVEGKERKEVSSTREVIVRNADRLKVEGAKEEEIVGAVDIKGMADYNLCVGENYNIYVIKEKKEVLGSRDTTLTQGGSKLEIKSLKGGNIEENIVTPGSKKTTINAGNIEEDIKAGNRTYKSKAGNYSVELVAGNMSFSTKTGQVGIKTSAGKVTIGATLGVDIKAQPAGEINLRGGSINLRGAPGLMGGVITDKTHFDYITGAPLKGSNSVKASF